MEELIEYEFISWVQFAIVAFGLSLVIFVLSRLHVFNKYAKEKSMGFRMLVYLFIIFITVLFLLIRPFFHFLFLLVVFGLFFKNIVCYTRALFSLYYSNVKFGDKIKIGEVTGTLDSMNFGGIHLLTDDNRVYFPFNMWDETMITLESQSGSVLISFDCQDDLNRSEHNSISDLEKSLFNYPFLAVSNVNIGKEEGVYKVALRISNSKYKGGLFDHIGRAGFRINRNKT